MPTIISKVEGRRGCGYRKPGGIYLVSDGPELGCPLLPLSLISCPACSQGIKPARGWTWIQPPILLAAYFGQHGGVAHSAACPFGDCERLSPRTGLLWVGESFYPTPQHFTREAVELGVSRRIARVPLGFSLGQWVLLAHRTALPCPPCESTGDAVLYREGWTQAQVDTYNAGGDPPAIDCGEGGGRGGLPGIFYLFRPARIEYVVSGAETLAEIDKLESRGLTLVKLTRAWEQPTLPGLSSADGEVQPS